LTATAPAQELDAAARSAAFVCVPFTDLPGWDGTQAEALVDGLSRHFSPSVRVRPHQAPWLAHAAEILSAPSAPPKRIVEKHFVALRIATDGFLTGYYEPFIRASRVRTARFTVPLHRRPPDLVRVNPPRSDLPGDGTFARRCADGSLTSYFDRREIRDGALDGNGLKIAFVEDPVDAFFAQVQGSARLVMDDGEEVRIGYHGKTGHPYTPIGRVLIDRGFLPEGGATMQSIRATLAAQPEIVPSVLEANRSYVFFRERPCMGGGLGPIAAGGVPLVPWRSLAVDRRYIRLGTPVFVETRIPVHGPHTGVTIAEDTGTAIVGPARGDLFFGSGEAAGALAGSMKARARLTLIVPKEAAV